MSAYYRSLNCPIWRFRAIVGNLEIVWCNGVEGELLAKGYPNLKTPAMKSP